MVRVSPLVVSCNNFVLCVCGSGLSLCACQLFFFFSVFFFLPLPRCSLAPLQVPHFFQKLKERVSLVPETVMKPCYQKQNKKLLREKGIESDGYFFFKCSLPLAICLFSYIHLNKRQLLLILVSYPPLLQPRNFSSSFFFLNSHSLPSLLVTQSSYEAGIIPSRK